MFLKVYKLTILNYTQHVPCDQCDTGFQAAGSWVKTGKGHAISLQAGTGPYGSRRFRPPEFLDN
jgi:hypothetical protein